MARRAKLPGRSAANPGSGGESARPSQTKPFLPRNENQARWTLDRRDCPTRSADPTIGSNTGPSSTCSSENPRYLCILSPSPSLPDTDLASTQETPPVLASVTPWEWERLLALVLASDSPWRWPSHRHPRPRLMIPGVL